MRNILSADTPSIEDCRGFSCVPYSVPTANVVLGTKTVVVRKHISDVTSFLIKLTLN